MFGVTVWELVMCSRYHIRPAIVPASSSSSALCVLCQWLAWLGSHCVPCVATIILFEENYSSILNFTFSCALQNEKKNLKCRKIAYVDQMANQLLPHAKRGNWYFSKGSILRRDGQMEAREQGRPESLVHRLPCYLPRERGSFAACAQATPREEELPCLEGLVESCGHICSRKRPCGNAAGF